MPAKVAIIGSLVVAAALLLGLADRWLSDHATVEPRSAAVPTDAERGREAQPAPPALTAAKGGTGLFETAREQDPAATGADTRAPGDGGVPTGDRVAPSISPPPPPPPQPAYDEPGQLFSIFGWVGNDAGEPVPRIQVEARLRRLFRDRWEDAPAWQPDSVRTSTDADGFYVIEDVADGEYEISTPETPRYAPGRLEVRAGVESADLILVQRRTIAVHGRVTGADGRPLSGVQVRSMNRPRGETAISDQAGNYEIPLTVAGQRTLVLSFRLDGYREQRPKVDVTAADANASARLDVRLDPVQERVEVRGSVTGTEGEPIPKAVIRLSSWQLRQRYRAISDSAGYFTFPEVEVGSSYRLSAQAKAPYRDWGQNVVISEDLPDLELVLESTDYGSLAGYMVDPAGNPLPHFSLWLRARDNIRQHPLLVRGDGAGYFFVPEVLAGRLKLYTSSSPVMSIEGLRIEPGTTQFVRLSVDWGVHQLTGWILDARGNVVRGAQAVLTWRHVEDGVRSLSTRRAPVDANGFFVFTNLGAGMHTLYASAAGFGGTQIQHEVGAGEDEITIRLQENPSY